MIEFLVILLLEQNILALFRLKILYSLIRGSQFQINLLVLKLDAKDFSFILPGNSVKLCNKRLLLLLLFVNNLLKFLFQMSYLLFCVVVLEARVCMEGCLLEVKEVVAG